MFCCSWFFKGSLRIDLRWCFDLLSDRQPYLSLSQRDMGLWTIFNQTFQSLWHFDPDCGHRFIFYWHKTYWLDGFQAFLTIVLWLCILLQWLSNISCRLIQVLLLLVLSYSCVIAFVDIDSLNDLFWHLAF